MVQQWNSSHAFLRNHVQAPCAKGEAGSGGKTRRTQVAASAIAVTLLVGTVSGIKVAQRVLGASDSLVVGVTVPMRVTPGASLWSLARRYGNPQKNIVDRVE